MKNSLLSMYYCASNR